MSDYQARLKLAREAYQATLPDLEEVNAGVARVGSQLAPPATQLRRLMQLLGGGALVAGLGLMGSAALPDGDAGPPPVGATEPTEAPLAAVPHGHSEALQAQLHAAKQPLQTQPAGRLVPITAGSAADADAPLPTSSAGGRRLPARGLQPPSVPQPEGATKAPGASWAAVSGALERGDSQAASGILAELASSDDASTRAKALLGQAQIHLSRGERAEAKRLAAAAANVPGASDVVRMKAVRWAARASL